MKTNVRVFMLLLLIVFAASQVFAQGRRGQFELYAGVNIPLGPSAPEDISLLELENMVRFNKDFYKIGFSLNGQYVFFPAHNIGIPVFAGYEFFTVDNDAIGKAFGDPLIGLDLTGFGDIITDANLSTDGSASIIRFGAGLRPYITPPEASTQFFLFGNATFNIIKTKGTLNSASLTVNDVTTVTVTKADFEAEGVQTESDNSENKAGVAIGAGIEIPAGQSINIIIQGLFNLVFTSSEDIEVETLEGDFQTVTVGGTTSFIGITAGIVF